MHGLKSYSNELTLMDCQGHLSIRIELSNKLTTILWILCLSPSWFWNEIKDHT